MTITRQMYGVIQRAIKARRMQVSLNTTWRAVYAEYGLGRIVGNHLNLTPGDHVTLRQAVIQDLGLDPLADTLDGDRMALAAKARDEKLAKEAVFAGMLKVNRRKCAVPLTTGEALTPPGTLLSVNADALLADGLEHVILIENGAVARQWHRCQIPSGLDDALMVYRGHDHEARTVRRWLNELPPHVQKIGYFDFDPAGIGMAVDWNMDAILIPDPLSEDLVSAPFNKVGAYHAQVAARPNLARQVPTALRPIWDWVYGHRCAITQESLTAREWPLSLLQID